MPPPLPSPPTLLPISPSNFICVLCTTASGADACAWVVSNCCHLQSWQLKRRKGQNTHKHKLVSRNLFESNFFDAKRHNFIGQYFLCNFFIDSKHMFYRHNFVRSVKNNFQSYLYIYQKLFMSIFFDETKYFLSLELEMFLRSFLTSSNGARKLLFYYYYFLLKIKKKCA